MTLLGKIFTVLIMVMSVVFMSFSIVVYATHTNWKAEAEGLKQNLDQQLERNQQLEARKQRLLDNLALEQAAREPPLRAAWGARGSSPGRARSRRARRPPPRRRSRPLRRSARSRLRRTP